MYPFMKSIVVAGALCVISSPVSASVPEHGPLASEATPEANESSTLLAQNVVSPVQFYYYQGSAPSYQVYRYYQPYQPRTYYYQPYYNGSPWQYRYWDGGYDPMPRTGFYQPGVYGRVWW